jgi:hypothetical protein
MIEIVNQVLWSEVYHTNEVASGFKSLVKILGKNIRESSGLRFLKII